MCVCLRVCKCLCVLGGGADGMGRESKSMAREREEGRLVRLCAKWEVCESL